MVALGRQRLWRRPSWSRGARRVRREGKPLARMDDARFGFAVPGRRTSQCRYLRELEAMMGWNISSSVGSMGEDSWTKVNRWSC